MIKQIVKSYWKLNLEQEKILPNLIEWLNNDNTRLQRSVCLCGSNETFQVADSDRFGLNFSAVCCLKCGLIYTFPMMAEKDLGEYYNLYYHGIVLGSHNPKQNLFAVGQGNKIFSQVYPHIDKKNRILNVFEVGAAAGSVLNEFRESAKKNNFDCILSGLEYNREYVEAAKKLDVNLFSRELLDFVRSTKEKYDVIILSHVLEHTINPRQFLLEIKKIAKEKTGIIYIEVPGVFVLHKRLAYSAKFEKYFVHAHNFHFTKDSLSKLAYDSGFKCLSKNENVEMVLLNDENEEKIKFDADISVKNMRRYLFVLRKFRLFFLTLLIPLKITNFFTNLKNKNKSIE